ncbi:MAG: DNA polymerase/3'-5' exonuclease PolX [Nitrospira sp.]
MTKHEVAHVLKEIGFFLFLKGENPYRAQAYERAGTALLASPLSLAELVSAGSLTDISGIGPATARVITDLVETGQSPVLHEARGSYPSSLMTLNEVPRLSRKHILKLYEQAGITSVAELKTACHEGRLLTVPGIGPKVQAKLLEALGEYERGQGYSLYADVIDEAHDIEQALKKLTEGASVSLSGSLRRKMEVVNEYVFVVACDAKHPVARLTKHLRSIPNLTGITVRDETITARSATGMPMRIVVTSSRQFGFVLLHTTGSAEHLDEVLHRFQEQGLQDWSAVQSQCAKADETALYHAIGLPYIPPELREGRGEVAWASQGTLAPLVEPRHIQGVFHVHTDYSDGAGTVEEMVTAARRRGCRYLGISDHSQSAFYANGLKEPRIRAQWQEIDQVQQRHRDIHIFKGIEADILPDGSMDYPNEVLAQFDFVIASVHSRFNLTEADQTRRICKALANPYVTMLGHPTGRLLLSRSGYRVNLDRVIAAAAQHHKVLEINGSRHRLDLDWRWVRVGKARRVQFCVNPDAHAVEEFGNVTWGANVAQKAGLSKRDVLNTRSLKGIKSFFRQSRVQE